jgi:LmbE family N-acetylglucosaminyl deacetylase
MRRALIVTLILLTLWRIDRRRAKELLRRSAIFLCHVSLKRLSPRYTVNPGSAIFIAPHQDDETLACGGLIARKRYEGLPVQVLFITDGSASHPTHPRLSPTAITAIRQQEAREALRILGVESGAIHFLGAPDGRLNHLTPSERTALVEKISVHLTATQPSEIFLPCSPDGSTEHDAAFTVICEAVLRCEHLPVIWQYPVWSWWNPLLMIERIIFTTDNCHQPTEDFQYLKNRALGCYLSQITPLPPEKLPALPSDLVRIFRSDSEFFFRLHLTRPPRAGAPVEAVI